MQDSGLLLFGEWRNITWGRVQVREIPYGTQKIQILAQVHYHDTRLIATRCTQADENSVEECEGCSIERHRGTVILPYPKDIPYPYRNPGLGVIPRLFDTHNYT